MHNLKRNEWYVKIENNTIYGPYRREIIFVENKALTVCLCYVYIDNSYQT